jgi:ATP-binding cassette subfamily B (MDR/TAP) protein 1
MGDGTVLEKGTHNELLQDEKSAYSRLVRAQKLREQKATNGEKDDESDTAADEPEDMEKLAQKEVPLGRKTTGRSLGSEILEKRRAEAGEGGAKEYGLPYLFMRMGKINRDQWVKYTFGTLFACSA